MTARRAFTLVELLVAVALGTILVGVVAFIFMHSQRVYRQSLQEIAAASELRAALERLARDLRDMQPARSPGWEPRLLDRDGASGPEDALELVTLERRATITPVRVAWRLGAPDPDGLRPLLRQVINRGVDGALPDPPSGPEAAEEVLGRLRAFRVEYAWPSQDPSAPGGGASHHFLRGAGAGPWAGPPASDGQRFVLRGAGTLRAGTLTLGSPPYDGTRPLPRRLAHTLHVTTPGRAGALPILDVVSPDTLTVAGAPDGDVELWISLLPPALQVTVDHATPNGARSVTQVMTVTP